MYWQRTYKATQARKRSPNHEETFGSNEKVPANSMLAASYYTGVGYQDVKSIINITGRSTQSRATYFRHQKECEKNLKTKSNELQCVACQRFSGNLSLDCRWSSKTRGIHGTVSAIDEETDEVLATATLTKFHPSRPEGNFGGSSNAMETEGTKKVMSILEERGVVDQIKNISKDRDNKNKKTYSNYNLNQKIRYDPGHFRNSFKTALKKMINDTKAFRYITNDNQEIVLHNPFDGLEGRLLKWFNTCLKESDDSKRLAMWLSTVPHYLGDQSSCIHPEDEVHQIWWQGVEHEPLINVLNELIYQFSKDIGNTSVQHSSQCVE